MRARIDISENLEGDAVVLACLDLDEAEIEASAHALAAVAAERFRMTTMSADDVLELRELTALTDELAVPSGDAPIRTVVLGPDRLEVYRDAIAGFVDARDEADWIRDEDREPLARVRELLPPLEQLCAEATRATMSGAPRGA